MQQNPVRCTLIAVLGLSGLTIVAAQDRAGRGAPIKEERLVSYGKDGIATVRITWHIRPPFYKGSLPFTYLAGIREYGVQYGIRSVAWADFGDFRVTYEMDRNFNAVLPSVGRAVGRNGELLAEARVTRFVNGPSFEVQETHFGPGKRVTFECRSLFDSRGWKIEETATKGAKSGEYFFLWSSER